MATKKTRKTSKKLTSKKSPKPVIIKTPALYSGAAVLATKVYKRKMSEFKNCDAFCWLAINEVGGVFTTANSYNCDVPKASYNPSDYTYPLDEKAQKKIAAKLQDTALGYVEIEEVTEWPAWVRMTTEKASKVSRKAAREVGRK